MELQQKVMNAFIGKVVRKDLAFLVKGGLPVPTYVLEYLLGQYCASDDEEVINDGLEKVKQVIKNNWGFQVFLLEPSMSVRIPSYCRAMAYGVLSLSAMCPARM